jgi:hypothetical protein
MTSGLIRVLTDRGTEYCGDVQKHPYELYFAIEDIDHARTKARSPQTSGIVERLHKTMLNEFYRTAFCKNIYRTIEELQADLDAWMREHNTRRRDHAPTVRPVSVYTRMHRTRTSSDRRRKTAPRRRSLLLNRRQVSPYRSMMTACALISDRAGMVIPGSVRHYAWGAPLLVTKR